MPWNTAAVEPLMFRTSPPLWFPKPAAWAVKPPPEFEEPGSAEPPARLAAAMTGVVDQFAIWAAGATGVEWGAMTPVILRSAWSRVWTGLRIDPARVEEARAPVTSTLKAKIFTADIANLLFVALEGTPSWRTLPRRLSAVVCCEWGEGGIARSPGRIVRAEWLGGRFAISG